MYEANGVTTGFPLSVGADGSTVVLISPAGAAIKMSGESYAVQNGTVFFYTPPPSGWIVAFEMPVDAVAPRVCMVVYPNGVIKELSQDPWELLALAATERDEAKKLLKEVKNAVDLAERVVHVESEVAKEKLSARLEKYGTLVEDSIKQAANGARDEVKDYLAELIQEILTKHDETRKARDETFQAVQVVEELAEHVASRTEERVKSKLEFGATRAMEAYERVRAMRSEFLEFRDEAKNASNTAAAKLHENSTSFMNVVIEEVRGLRAVAENEMKTTVYKAVSEVSRFAEEARTAKDATQAATVRAIQIEQRCVELDKAHAAREEGMRALWTRITGFKKTFDHRVSQMRSSVAELGEGEE